MREEIARLMKECFREVFRADSGNSVVEDYADRIAALLAGNKAGNAARQTCTQEQFDNCAPMRNKIAKEIYDAFCESPQTWETALARADRIAALLAGNKAGNAARQTCTQEQFDNCAGADDCDGTFCKQPDPDPAREKTDYPDNYHLASCIRSLAGEDRELGRRLSDLEARVAKLEVQP